MHGFESVVGPVKVCYSHVLIINTLLTYVRCVSQCLWCVSGSRSFQQVVNVVGVVNIIVAFDNLCMYTTIDLKAELYLNLNPCTIGLF